MIESIMYIAIGFLVAGLLVIGFIPMVHARAVRLTRRRLEAMTPMSMAEINAEKDQLRAEFAMSIRRLEMSLEQMKAKTSTQLAQLGKKGDAIGRLKLELDEKAAALVAAEAKIAAMTEELEGTKRELAAKTDALRRVERTLGERVDDLGKLSGRLNDTALTADSQRVELAAALAKAEVLRGEIDGYEQEIGKLQRHLDTQSEAAETAGALLAEERLKTETFGTRIKEFENQLTMQTTERALAEEQLKQSVEERERLAREFATMKEEVENATAAERMETAVMRERLNDVAAEVACLTAVLEGPNSPIEAILAAEAPDPNGVGNANSRALDDAGHPANDSGRKNSLAERIRALQSKRPELPQGS